MLQYYCVFILLSSARPIGHFQRVILVKQVVDELDKKPTNWWGRQNVEPLEFIPNCRRRHFRSFYSNFDKYRPQVADDLISSMAVGSCNSWWVWFKQWLWPAGPVSRITFWQYLTAFCSRPEVTSGVISGVVIDPTAVKVHVKFGDPRSNRSRDIRLPHFVAEKSVGRSVAQVHTNSRFSRPCG